MLNVHRPATVTKSAEQLEDPKKITSKAVEKQNHQPRPDIFGLPRRMSLPAEGGKSRAPRANTSSLATRVISQVRPGNLAHEPLFSVDGIKNYMLHGGEGILNDDDGIPLHSAWVATVKGHVRILGQKRADGTFQPVHAETRKPMELGRTLFLTPSAGGDVVLEKSGLNGGGPPHYEYRNSLGTKYWYRSNQPEGKNFYYSRAWHTTPPIEESGMNYHFGEGAGFWFDSSKSAGSQFGYLDGWHAQPPVSQLDDAKPSAASESTGPFAGNSAPRVGYASFAPMLAPAAARNPSNVNLSALRRNYDSTRLPEPPLSSLTLTGANSDETDEFNWRLSNMRIAQTPGAYQEEVSSYATPSQALTHAAYHVPTHANTSSPMAPTASLAQVSFTAPHVSLNSGQTFSGIIHSNLGVDFGLLDPTGFAYAKQLVENSDVRMQSTHGESMAMELMRSVASNVYSGSMSRNDGAVAVDKMLHYVVDKDSSADIDDDAWRQTLMKIVFFKNEHLGGLGFAVDEPVRENLQGEIPAGDQVLIRQMRGW